MATARIARARLPAGDPRDWLLEEVVRHGAVALPLVMTAGTSSERRVVATLPASLSQGQVEALFLADPDVQWVSAWGTTVLRPDGKQALITWARLRFREGRGYVAFWTRAPGVPPELEHVETWEGKLRDVPAWLAELFPPLDDTQAASFEEVSWDPQPWPSDAHIRTPDATIAVHADATLQDIALTIGHRLEARFVTEGAADPTVAVWHDDLVSVWWDEGEDGAAVVCDIGRRLARHPETRALGLYGLGEDDEGGISMIALVLESRDGSSVMWTHHFAFTSADTAQWLEEQGELGEPTTRVGWFDE